MLVEKCFDGFVCGGGGGEGGGGEGGGGEGGGERNFIMKRQRCYNIHGRGGEGC